MLSLSPVVPEARPVLADSRAHQAPQARPMTTALKGTRAAMEQEEPELLPLPAPMEPMEPMVAKAA